MAEAAIGAGVNIGEASFGALLDIKASIDTLGDLTRELLRQQEAYEEYGPVQLSLRAAGVSPAAKDLVLNLGGPSYGRLWEVRRLVVGGANWAAVVGGRADIIIAANAPLNTPPRALSDVVDVAKSLPSVAFYSSGQLVLRNPQQLYVVIATPTATTQYAVGGGGFDVPDRPAYRVVGQ